MPRRSAGSWRHVTRSVSPGLACTGVSSTYAACQWKLQRGISSRSFARAGPGSARPGSSGRAGACGRRRLDRRRPRDRPVARRDVVDATGSAAFLPQSDEQRGRDERGAAAEPLRPGRATAASRSQSRPFSPLRQASSTGAGRSTVSSRRQAGRRRNACVSTARERSGRAPVEEVVVHLHHDRGCPAGSATPVPSRSRSAPQPGAQAEIQPASSRIPRGLPSSRRRRPGRRSTSSPAPACARPAAFASATTPRRCGRGSRGGRSRSRRARSAPRSRTRRSSAWGRGGSSGSRRWRRSPRSAR